MGWGQAKAQSPLSSCALSHACRCEDTVSGCGWSFDSSKEKRVVRLSDVEIVGIVVGGLFLLTLSALFIIAKRRSNKLKKGGESELESSSSSSSSNDSSNILVKSQSEHSSSAEDSPTPSVRSSSSSSPPLVRHNPSSTSALVLLSLAVPLAVLAQATTGVSSGSETRGTSGTSGFATSETSGASGFATTGTSGTSGSATTGTLSGAETCALAIEVVFRVNSGYACNIPTVTLRSSNGTVVGTVAANVPNVSCPCSSCNGFEIGCSRDVCGRPFVSGDGTVVVAQPAEGLNGTHADWCDDDNALPLSSRIAPNATLASSWLTAALAEHASVASFNAFSLQLLALGAPSSLIAGAQQAALDEVEHARLSFEMARRFGSRQFAPGKFPVAATVTADPEGGMAVAKAVAEEGCVDEMASTLEAALELSREVDRDARSVRRRIIKDEAGHAGLAWHAVAWLTQTQIQPDAREAVAKAIAQRLPRALGRLRRAGATLADLCVAAEAWYNLTVDTGVVPVARLRVVQRNVCQQQQGKPAGEIEGASSEHTTPALGHAIGLIRRAGARAV
jgi:hypothetical protein